MEHVITKNIPTGNDYSWADDEYKKRRLTEIANETLVWMGDHSYSYHSLRDIKDYLKKVKKYKTKKRGYVSEEDYIINLKGTNKVPESYSGGIHGPNIITMSMEKYENTKNIPSNSKVYIQYEWEVNYTDSTNINQIVEQLETLVKLYKVDDNDVRYVFGFDS